MGFLKFFILLLVLLTSCGQFMESDRTPFSRKGGVGSGEFNYDYVTTTNEISSKIIPTKEKINLVLISSFGCSACKDEHIHVKELIEKNKINLEEVEIFTIHIPYTIDRKDELVQQRDELLESNWAIGVDPDFYFFDNVCAEKVTPCTVIYNSDGSLSSTYMGTDKDIIEELNKAN